MLSRGWGDIDPPVEALYDLCFDPIEGQNLIDEPIARSDRRGSPRSAARLDGAHRRSTC